MPRSTVRVGNHAVNGSQVRILSLQRLLAIIRGSGALRLSWTLRWLLVTGEGDRCSCNNHGEKQSRTQHGEQAETNQRNPGTVRFHSASCAAGVIVATFRRASSYRRVVLLRWVELRLYRGI